MCKNPQIIFSVIIVDEESAVFTGLSDCIGEMNHVKLTHIKSIIELMDWCNSENTTDLVLLDSGFGNGLAYAIASFLKIKITPQPIIVLMPYFGMTPLTFALIAGCDEVICKPVHADELLAVLKKVERNHESKELEK
jgi:DNA-binding response OmpR family regulator